MSDVSVSADAFSTTIASVNSVYSNLVGIMDRVESFKSTLPSVWQGDGIDAVMQDLENVSTDLKDFKDTYGRFIESLGVLGSNYNQMESEISSSMC